MDGKHVSFETFDHEFRSRLTAIKHVLALISPWFNPTSLKRVWCNFEAHIATSLEGCDYEIIMPPSQERDFHQSLVAGVGLEKVWKAFAGIDIMSAQSSSEDDRMNILKLVEQDCKSFAEFNRRVTVKMQAGITFTAEQIVQDLIPSRQSRILSCVV